MRVKGTDLDKYAHVLFPRAVQLMPKIKFMRANPAVAGQGHLSCWRAACAFGIVEETF